MRKIDFEKLFLLFIMMLPQAVLAEDYAYRGKELKVVYIIGMALLVIRIVVPILLIVISSIDLVKALTQNDSGISETIKALLPKVIIAIIVFLLPSILSLILKLTDQSSLLSGYIDCLLTPSSCSVEMWENPPEIIDNSNKEPYTVIDPLNNSDYDDDRIGDKLEIVDISLSDTVVIISTKRANSKIKGYYFSSIEKEPDIDGFDWIPSSSTSFRTVKYPGTYYVYVKDEDGTIAGGNKVVVPADFDVTMMRNGKKAMPVTFETYLKNHNSSISAFNKEIATYNVKHGMKTRESVVVGAMAFTDKVYKWGYYLEYGGSNIAIEKNNWGVRNYWGGGSGRFLACDPFVVWAYKNAGLNIYASRTKMSRYTNIVQTNRDGSTQEYKSYKSKYYTYDHIRIFFFFVGIVGSTSEIGDNIIAVNKGLPGDVLQNGRFSGHEMLIIDKYDDNMDGVSDGYIVLQSSSTGLCYEKRPYSAGVIVYDMSKVFNNTAGFASHLEGWQTYYIPTSDYPDYLKELTR